MVVKEIVLITGANTGIGFETVKALASTPKPYHIFLGARTLADAQEAISKVDELVPETKSTFEPLEVELTSDESIARAAEVVQSGFDRVDVLINNADVPNLRSIFNQSYDINVTGTNIFTAAISPLLLKSSSPRLIFLASGLSTILSHSNSTMPAYVPPAYDPPPKAGWPKEEEDGVRVWAISSGFLATHLGGSPEHMKALGAGDASLGGDIVRRVVEGERDADIGKVVKQNGAIQEW
ncbi:Short-chain dehydrogenase/reductase tropE [Cladobotryum mycophilum]|uniref:Short-chain dehydrogenase/reductase tropE n=1 Tax=Cladobotryum mycophilum TaxID=491253 RepID=A0ABR0SMY7_9HYPO